MLRLWIGIIGFILSIGLLLYFLPRHGRTHRLVKTVLGPYIAIAFCLGLGLSSTLILAAVVELIGAGQ